MLQPSSSPSESICNEQDIDIWEISGRESVFQAQAEFCILSYNGGCGFTDITCSELCIQDQYDYSNNCSKCFGILLNCAFEYACTVCISDQGRSEGCVECLSPCLEEFYSCSSLPEPEETDKV